MLWHLPLMLHPGAILVPSWVILGSFGDRLGPSWSPLGLQKAPQKPMENALFAQVEASCYHVASSSHLSKNTVNAEGKCSFMGHLGVVLGPSWGPLGVLLGPSWAILGDILRYRAAS